MSNILPRYYFKFYNPSGFPDGGAASISTSSLIDVSDIEIIYRVTGGAACVTLQDKGLGEDNISLFFYGITSAANLDRTRYYIQDVLENLRSQSWTNNVHEFGDSTTGEFSFKSFDGVHITTKLMGYKIP